METKRLLNIEAFSVVSYNVDGTAIPIGIAYTIDGNIKYTSFDENGPERVFIRSLILLLLIRCITRTV